MIRSSIMKQYSFVEPTLPCNSRCETLKQIIYFKIYYICENHGKSFIFWLLLWTKEKDEEEEEG